MINYCNICPRNCNIDRFSGKGYCKAPNDYLIAKITRFSYEEPVICGNLGTAAVFFSGCTLRCCFCQNKEISHEMKGLSVSENKFAEILLNLTDSDIESISLISPTPYIANLIRTFEKIKHKITVPIVYNTSGYEKAETIKLLKDYVDVYMPDIKFMNSAYSMKYSNAENYFRYCSEAIFEMLLQKPCTVYKQNKTIKSGVLIRHLVMPGLYKDSIDILEWLKKILDENNFTCLVSIMSQYTPYHKSNLYPEINRRITSYEYGKVVNKANQLNLDGYMQDRKSSNDIYVPNFDFEGII